MNKKVKVSADKILDKLFMNIYTAELTTGEVVGMISFEQVDADLVNDVIKQFGVTYEMTTNKYMDEEEADSVMFIIVIDNNLKQYAPKMHKRFVDNLSPKLARKVKLNKLNNS